MPLFRMDDLMIQARKHGAALGAFECWDSLNVRGIAMAAKRCNSAVIFQATPLEYNLMGGADALADIVKFYVNKYDIAAALHLDHGSTLKHVDECLKSGFTSVMLKPRRWRPDTTHHAKPSWVMWAAAATAAPTANRF